MTDNIRARVSEILPGVRADLERLVAIPSVGADPARHDEVRRSAAAVAALFEAEGLDTRIVEENGGLPAVIAHKPAPEGQPTVLLYAHHDVQPEGRREDWHSEPFVATERDGRLYGRGAADDKAGVAAHLAAIRAWGGDLPVGVTVFVEGEEESGSPSLPALLETYRDELRNDVMVIADSANWEVGTPALTVSLRGTSTLTFELRTISHSIHSGMWGGVVPDALTATCRLLATLHDDRGNVAVDGLQSFPAADVEYPVDRFRAESGMLPDTQMIGDGSIVERLWTKPAISVIAMDTTPVDKASNTLIASVRATISCRVAPGDSCEEALVHLKKHLTENAPWGAQISFGEEDAGAPFKIDATTPAHDAAREAFTEAWDGTAPIDMGMGGAIPFIAQLSEMFPDSAVLVTGVEDPDTRAHGADESLHLAEFERTCLAEALLLGKLAR